ncbi:XRE family transcriptional regulator [Afipia sp. P52-10]|jgi:predicted transcriptional regulator/DNA-binding XRE family transcriptional regulator|uniref:helix-turn-helix domain-containing protein n=1 Tax=Afipia sp. P52-10 TaxID=1429916 RepID=UPI0003DF0E19|nr:helix-turn-helix transcriptional regulator [Afipia sp. P52-10]ETR75827.1 XRE family transcriptional regulator [Afipia sp. P52-10]
MATQSTRSVFMGPRLRRIRRDLGLTQADMAADLDISGSYVALLERNQRPVTADMLLRLARTYKIDIADLAGDGGADHTARMQAVLKDPMFADIDMPSLEVSDVATSYPGITEAFLRLYTAYREEQLALADRGGKGTGGAHFGDIDANDPVAEVRRFLAARRNNFPQLDDAAERLVQVASGQSGFIERLKIRHNLTVRHLPPEVMLGSTRRLDRHRRQLLLDDSLDTASLNFQLAQQLAYLEMEDEIRAAVEAGHFATESGELLARRALAGYAAAALIMPYSAFAKAAEARHYDLEALARQFGTSFEQTAHRITTLQRPGQEKVPFFLIRVDPAGNVSKLLDGAGFPFARHGGACPLWSVHRVFSTPRQIVTQWLELPDGQRFFSIARTVTAGGGAFGAARVDRAIAVGCAAEHASRLIYTRGGAGPDASTPTPIGVACRVCHRPHCAARSALPIGRELLPDDFRRLSVPFGFSDS